MLWFNSYGYIKLDVGKEVNFAKGCSREDMLPTGITGLVLTLGVLSLDLASHLTPWPSGWSTAVETEPYKCLYNGLLLIR